jgi:putative sterol carrier protein
MPVFPSREWCEEAIRLLNADPDSAAAGAGWEGDFGLVVEAEPGKLTESFAVHCVPEDGRVRHFEILEDPDDFDAIEPAYLAKAPYSVWKGLILGILDPVEVILGRQMTLRGDLQPLVERMKYRPLGDRVFAQLRTEFADERAGHL